jgi:hypothetical protein
MTEYEQYNIIHLFIINGQRERAANQMRELSNLGAIDMCDLIDYFADNLNDKDLAIEAAKIYINNP